MGKEGGKTLAPEAEKESSWRGRKKEIGLKIV